VVRHCPSSLLPFAGEGPRRADEGVFWPFRLAAVVLFCLIGFPSFAAPVANPVAMFSGLDKITARLTKFDVYMNETVQFGSLQVTPRACYTAPVDEPPHTLVFAEVDRVGLKGDSARIFTGWMFADSPALNAIDDPLYDVWLVGCAAHSDLPPPTAINPLPGPISPPADRAGLAAVPKATGSKTTAPPVQQVESGSFVTLLNPAPAAESSPDGQ
jgi:hypothetical protein